MSKFDKEAILSNMEMLRKPNGAFIAAPGEDYNAMWLRDTLYTNFAYWYVGEHEKLKQGMHIVFDFFKKYAEKLHTRIASPIDISGGVIHAKCNADTLEEITLDNTWGHHQLDALGLFLHITSDLDFKNINVLRDKEDKEILRLIVQYLRSVEYWALPDLGMWEEDFIRHSSSIGSIVAGLSYVRRRRLCIVPDPLINFGEKALLEILPYESRDKCQHNHHSHDCDVAQLSLIWPYNIVSYSMASNILDRIINGHQNGQKHKLMQGHGINRYWGDDYYRSTQGKYIGVSAEWPMFLFWLSIIYSQRHDEESAITWFKKGCTQIVDNKIPEAYVNGQPNDHTPLAWAHAIALIAFSKLSPEAQKQVSK